jgi:SNF2 family DNA or RNA helicase
MLVSKKHRKLVLNLNEPGRVLGVIPSARPIEYKGRTLVAVPHRIEEVRVLRNLGFDAPAPMGAYYDWPGRHKPYAHQQFTGEFLSMNPRAFCLNGMGSGKTISVLWAFHYLRSLGEVRRMLVVSPLSTLERAWGDEIFNNFPDINFAVLHGSREKRHKLLAGDFDIYIINHDGIKSPDTVKLLCDKLDIDIVVVDELASFRNSATLRWKCLNTVINGNAKQKIPPKKYAWGLTGTPTPNSPTDAWAQAQLIVPGRGPRYFGAFRDTVMRQKGPFKWEPRETALSTVADLLQPAVRFAREDCIDLPPTTHVTRHAPLSPEQKKAFDEMVRLFKTEHEGAGITAINEAVKMGKLLQICCGVAYGNEGEVTIPAGPRLELLKEVIEEADGKVLVFIPLTAALLMVAEELGRHWPVAVVHGATPRAERDTIFKEFQTPGRGARVIVANPGTLSHGLTLTEANTIVWYAPVHSNETHQQANARITRPGQKRNTLIVHIEGTPLEQKVYARLEGRQTMQGVLLDMLKET